MYAAQNNNNPEVIVALLKAGADIKARDKYGRTALIHAAKHSNPEVIATLLKSGANACVEDFSAWDENYMKDLERTARSNAALPIITNPRIIQLKKEQDEWFEKHPGADELFKEI